MKNRFVYLIASTLLAAGCAQSPPPPPTTSVTTINSKTDTVEANGKTRTEQYSRASHSDDNGSQVSTVQAAHQTNADGSESGHSSKSSTASNDTLGYVQDEHHINVSGANVTHEFPVTGQDVSVSGQAGHLVFRGQTHGLSVTGNDNQVQVENATLVEVSGMRNKISYSGSKPEIKQSGEGNSVQPQ